MVDKLREIYYGELENSLNNYYLNNTSEDESSSTSSSSTFLTERDKKIFTVTIPYDNLYVCIYSS